jgi:hypothetical protein
LAACGDEEASEAPAAGSAPAQSAALAQEDSFDDARLPTAEAMQKYQAECTGEATTACKRLQWQLEFALYTDLRELALANALDDELILAGAAADSPQLKAFSLDHILGRGLAPQASALVIAAFDDPYPSVRAVAQLLARQLPDERWARMLVRDSGWRSDGVRGLIAGVTPDASSLGAPPYPGSTHW